GASRQQLDPWPRILLWPGLGAIALGRSRREAEVAADIYEHTMSIVDAASALGGYEPVAELDLFDVEYWSLEQAKLKKAPDAPLAGKIAIVTGAASGIGLATVRALLGAGAHVALLDRNAETLETRAAEIAKAHPERVTHRRCDVTSAAEVAAAFAHTCAWAG